jgi:hypothetical protein
MRSISAVRIRDYNSFSEFSGYDRFSLRLNCDVSRWFAACAKRDYNEANAQAEED